MGLAAIGVAVTLLMGGGFFFFFFFFFFMGGGSAFADPAAHAIESVCKCLPGRLARACSGATRLARYGGKADGLALTLAKGGDGAQKKRAWHLWRQGAARA